MKSVCVILLLATVLCGIDGFQKHACDDRNWICPPKFISRCVDDVNRCIPTVHPARTRQTINHHHAPSSSNIRFGNPPGLPCTVDLDCNGILTRCPLKPAEALCYHGLCTCFLQDYLPYSREH